MALRAVDARDATIAAQLHALQIAADAQEAQRLRVQQFPPLQRSVRDVQAGGERWLAAGIAAHGTHALHVHTAVTHCAA